MTLLEKICDIELLIKCWRKIYRGKTKQQKRDSKGVDGVSLEDFKKNESKYLNEISELLQNGKFHFSSVKGIAKRKPGKDKDRLICVPTVKDRVVQRAILHIVNKFAYDYINTGVSFCGVRKNSLKRNKNEQIKNINSAIEKLIEHVKSGKFFIFESDFKGFFDNVPKEKLYKKITKLLPDSSLNSLIDNVINFHLENLNELEQNERISLPDEFIGISQGSSLSPLFSNIFLADFDKQVQGKYGDSFIRYVDDFLILVNTKSESLETEKFVKNLLKKTGIELSPGKTHHSDLRINRVEFLGLGIDKNGIACRIGKSQVLKKFNEVILNENRLRKSNERKISKRTYVARANSKIIGWGNFYRNYHVENLFKKLNELIKNRQKKSPELAGLKHLSHSKTKTLIPIEEWQSLFKS
jgi:group II intron reverse transcriptase/maturase